MRLTLALLLASLGATSVAVHADESVPADSTPAEITPTDGSFIARLKAGPGFYSGLSPVDATAVLGLDAGYRSFEGFGVIAAGKIFPSVTSGDLSVSSYFVGAVPTYTFDHGDLSLSFGLGLGYLHISESVDGLSGTSLSRFAVGPQIQADYNWNRDVFVNLELSFYTQTGFDNKSLIFPAIGAGMRF